MLFVKQQRMKQERDELFNTAKYRIYITMVAFTLSERKEHLPLFGQHWLSEICGKNFCWILTIVPSIGSI